MEGARRNSREGVPGGGCRGGGAKPGREGDVKEGRPGGTPRRRHRAADAGEGTPGRGRQERGFKEGRQGRVSALGEPGRGLWGVSPRRGAWELSPGRRPARGGPPQAEARVEACGAQRRESRSSPGMAPRGAQKNSFSRGDVGGPARERCEQL